MSCDPTLSSYSVFYRIAVTCWGNREECVVNLSMYILCWSPPPLHLLLFSWLCQQSFRALSKLMKSSSNQYQGFRPTTAPLCRFCFCKPLVSELGLSKQPYHGLQLARYLVDRELLFHISGMGWCVLWHQVMV